MFARREVLIGTCAALLSPLPAPAQQSWQKAKVYGVDFDVPAGWKRRATFLSSVC